VLSTISRYRFVVVDESHTLRNDKRRDYQAVLEYIDRVGAKALLLTATPYNRRFEDVANQLGLFIQPDEDLGISPVNALAADARLADRVDGKITTLQAFKRSEDPDDWKRLMSEHLVRRTRTFIKNNYSETDDDGSEYLRFADGTKFRFPDRVARPIDHPFEDGDPAALMVSDETLNTLQNLVLPRYSLIAYVDEKRKSEWTDEDKAIVENLRRARGQVAGFVRTTLYKRLSSGGHAFTLSLRRHVARNELFLYAIDNGLPLPTGTIQEADLLDDDDIIEHEVDDTERLGDVAAQRYQTLVDANPGYVTWIRPELFTPGLRDALLTDTEALAALLDAYGPWEIGRDSKLAALAKLITETHPDDKVLIFTEYKDTANYVASAPRSLGVESVDAATGDDEDPTQLARRFSPQSNKLRGKGDAEHGGDELRVLVSTDVLSEGQNLQDAHIVVNYDLPWAIVRLIQRAGRVDRVGQESPEVLLYSIFHGSLNNVLSLRQRIAARLQQNAQAFGSDEQFFGSEEEVRTINDLYDGTLDEAEDVEDIDAASLAYQYWSNALEQTPEAAERARRLPDLVDATRAKRVTDVEEGVGCYVRTEAGIDGFGWTTPAGETRLLTGFTDLVRGPLANPVIAAGRLRGVRRQIWKRLGESILDFGPEASAALDLLYQPPLTNEADRRLRNAVRNGASDDELANRVAALAREDKLVIERRSGNDSIRIVSTMGVR